jgi:nucleotide-binding universal stress UspA family protein
LTGPILICYDRTVESRHAIERAAALFPGRHAIILNLWDFPLASPADQLGTSTAGEDVERSAADAAITEGCRIAQQAGLDAEPLSECGSVKGTWQTIVATADAHHASVIVVGTRGRGEFRSLMLGSVSADVARHADRPVLVIPPRVKSATGTPERLARPPAAHWTLSLRCGA